MHKFEATIKLQATKEITCESKNADQADYIFQQMTLEIEEGDREFLMEFEQLLGVKGEVLNRFDKLYKDQVKTEPTISTFKNVFLPLAFLVLDEARELILEKLSEEKIQEKVL